MCPGKAWSPVSQTLPQESLIKNLSLRLACSPVWRRHVLLWGYIFSDESGFVPSWQKSTSTTIIFPSPYLQPHSHQDHSLFWKVLLPQGAYTTHVPASSHFPWAKPSEHAQGMQINFLKKKENTWDHPQPPHQPLGHTAPPSREAFFNGLGGAPITSSWLSSEALCRNTKRFHMATSGSCHLSRSPGKLQYTHCCLPRAGFLFGVNFGSILSCLLLPSWTPHHSIPITTTLSLHSLWPHGSNMASVKSLLTP